MAHTSPGDSLIAATRSFLTRFPPFDAMEDDALAFLASRLALGYYPGGTVIVAPEHGEPAFLYIVQRGLVCQTEALPAAQDRTVTLGPGEVFPVGALLERRAVASTYSAGSDTFCYQLASEDFRTLLGRSRRFADFARATLSSLLRDSRRLLKIHAAASASEEQAANRSLRSLVRRKPVCCAPDAAIGQALRAMKDAGVGSILIAEPEGKLVGILTRHDVLDRIALGERGLGEPVRVVMTPHPKTLPADATAYDAALLIARNGIRHIPVMEGRAVIGVVTERDLFALQHVGMRATRRAIASAGDLASLQAAADGIRTSARNMLEQGLGAEQLTYVVSTLNDALTERVIELESEHHRFADIGWCWLAFGSEGRYEQTIATDQDNGIVFVEPPGTDAYAARERLLPFAQAVNRTLDACGFPLCIGNIMAGNPRWCLSLGEWRLRFERWISRSEPQELLEAVIFFDLRPLFGRHELVEQLRETLLALVSRNPVFLRHLAAQALETGPPLGLLGTFATDDGPARGTIDLKKSAARLFVDAARVFGLAASVTHTNTAQRLRSAGPRLHLTADEVASAVEGFFFIQSLRLRAQLFPEQGGAAGSNRVDPERLNEVDRRILKESLRQARRLQSRLRLDYRL